ncbi:MAG: S-layer homology domain-containing protein [Peptoniphilus lacydonensis]|uniref:S-layer homology domain-containing protein n=1 Tax=Peptoniphilus lacydonensis TaxID=1673725 RepID=UPI002900F8FA|nr:S-layer homology domain-containing protein [Peptoniphilus lacydonensis]MDU1954673.1 S-layer homology domain-containing protein [Peptoniphilus lacydonensis]MDU5275602.1 S-layer homology domain-containing protein [Peptoniphilus lacydonensis]
MKKIFIFIIVLIMLPFSVFASKEIAMPLNVSAIKEKENYTFEVKNANKNDQIEVEVTSVVNSNKKSKIIKNISEKNNKKYISISQSELDNLVGPSSGYSFRLRFAKGDNSSNFTGPLHLGKATVFRNYSSWAYEDLLKAQNLKILSKDTFSNAKEKITREELAEIVVKTYETKYKRSAQGSVKHFTDTDNKYVNMAYDLGLMKGKSDGKFLPKAHITREDYAVVISNLFNLRESKNIKIEDEKNISNYAKDSVNKSISGNYLNLDSNKKFNPKNEMKREEVISSIVRNI